jgi:hypothetical protein
MVQAMCGSVAELPQGPREAHVRVNKHYRRDAAAADDQLEAYNALVRAIFWLVAELPQGKGGPMPLPHHPQ